MEIYKNDKKKFNIWANIDSKNRDTVLGAYIHNCALIGLLIAIVTTLILVCINKDAILILILPFAVLIGLLFGAFIGMILGLIIMRKYPKRKHKGKSDYEILENKKFKITLVDVLRLIFILCLFYNIALRTNKLKVFYILAPIFIIVLFSLDFIVLKFKKIKRQSLITHPPDRNPHRFASRASAGDVDVMHKNNEQEKAKKI